jgi:hypothetical protein
MTYEDRMLVRLADPASRAGVFDAAGLEQLLSAAYDTDAMAIEGPFTPVFDEFSVGVALPRLADVEGSWMPSGGVDKVEARFQLSGLGTSDVIRVDALWRGAVVARTAHVTGRINAVNVAWPDMAAIDAEIIAALGNLPADPVVLEQERRQRFVTRLRAAFNQPALLSDARFDDWLRSTGATSVSDLLTNYRGVLHTGAMQVTIDQPAPPPTSPKALPVAAAILVRDQGFVVGQLLMESKLVRQRLDTLGLGRPRDASVKQRESLLVVWVLPATVFNDTDWPGASAGERRAAAGQWLAREGIGLVATA